MADADKFKPRSPRGVDRCEPEFGPAQQNQLFSIVRKCAEDCQNMLGAMTKANPTAMAEAQAKAAKKESARLISWQYWNPADELPDIYDEDPAGDPSQPMEEQSPFADYAETPPPSRSPSPPQNPR